MRAVCPAGIICGFISTETMPTLAGFSTPTSKTAWATVGGGIESRSLTRSSLRVASQHAVVRSVKIATSRGIGSVCSDS